MFVAAFVVVMLELGAVTSAEKAAPVVLTILIAMGSQSMTESLPSNFQSIPKRPMAVLIAQAFRLSSIALAYSLFAAACATASDLPPHFVRLADVAPSIRQDIRYAGSNNFTGRPVPGYAVAECWLRKEAALALATAQTDALKQGLKLVVYDCYRPQRATNAFVKWANDDAPTK